MATGNTPIVDNAARFPQQIASAISQRPSMLSEETLPVVREVAKALARKGYSAEMLKASEGLDIDRKAIVRAACNPSRTIH